MLKLSLLLAASVASVELISAKIDDGKMDKKRRIHRTRSRPCARSASIV